MATRVGDYHRRIVKALSMKLQRLESLGRQEKNSDTKQGTYRWRVLGVQRTLADDFQHICMELEWAPLLCLILLVYSAVSVFFAVGFYLLIRASGGGHLMGERAFDSDFEECLWMSVGHLVTIGYGGLLPASRAAFVLATLEHFAGILLSAVLLGIAVTKASLPASRLVFSDKIVFTRRNGKPILIFRVGNTRGNFLLNPEVRVSYFRPVNTVEGENIWVGNRIDVQEPPQLAPTFNLAHTITEDSPFYQMTKKELEGLGGSLGVTLSATDDHSLQTLYARKHYTENDIVFDMRFGDVLVKGKDGKRTVDFRKFNDLYPVEGLPEWVGVNTAEKG